MTGNERGEDGDMTGRDPVSSSAEGDVDAGSAALEGLGAPEAENDELDEAGSEDGFASGPPHPEAYDDTPVTDAPPVGGPDAGSQP